MIAILDYGIGNVFSIFNMLRKIGVAAEVTNDPSKVESAAKVILPGVGHFSYCMKQLKAAPFFSILQEKVMGSGIPILGVCVGCQMLMEKSEEGNEDGLGWIKGQVVRFDEKKMESAHKIPHMGWSDIYPETGAKLFWKIHSPRFYFVHSYHVVAKNKDTEIATANYGYTFTAAVAQENILGVQFHPEKSHSFGMKLYENFAKYY